MGLQVEILGTIPITGDDQVFKKQTVRAITEVAAERTGGSASGGFTGSVTVPEGDTDLPDVPDPGPPPVAFDDYSVRNGYSIGPDYKTASDTPVTLLNDGYGDFYISGGMLAHPVRTSGAQSAAYMGVELSERVREMWMDVLWTNTGKTGDELAVLVNSSKRFTQTPYPDAGGHVLFARTGSWVYQTYNAGPIVVASGAFPTIPYGTLCRVGARWRGSEAELILPDGSTSLIVDPDIATWGGNHATFEAFAAGNNNPISISRWEATAEPQSGPYVVEGVGRFIKSGTDVTTALSGSFTIVDSMQIVVPKSRALDVTASEWVTQTTASHLYAQVDVGGNATSIAVQQLYQGKTIDEMVTVRGVVDLSDFAPGTVATLNIRLLTTGTASHYKNFSSTNRRQSITAIPVIGQFA